MNGGGLPAVLPGASAPRPPGRADARVRSPVVRQLPEDPPIARLRPLLRADAAALRPAALGLAFGGRAAWAAALAAHGLAIAAAVWCHGALAGRARIGSGDRFAGLCVAPERTLAEVAESPAPPELPPMPAEPVPLPPEPADPALEPGPEPVTEILPDSVALPPVPETRWPLAGKRVRPSSLRPATAAAAPAPALPAAPRAPAAPPSRPAARSGQSLRPLATPRPPAPRWLTLQAPLRLDLRFQVDADGTLREVQVTRSSGLARLDEEVRDFVAARWRFEPPGTARWALQAIHFEPTAE